MSDQHSSTDTAESRAIAKLRAFMRDGLDADERVVLARLLAPAVAQAFDEEGDEVEGFTAVQWRPTIPETLAQSIRDSGLRVASDDL
jgi:hypothetical protein